MWASDYNIAKTIFYLLKGDYGAQRAGFRVLELKRWVLCRVQGIRSLQFINGRTPVSAPIMYGLKYQDPQRRTPQFWA